VKHPHMTTAQQYTTETNNYRLPAHPPLLEKYTRGCNAQQPYTGNQLNACKTPWAAGGEQHTADKQVSLPCNSTQPNLSELCPHSTVPAAVQRLHITMSTAGAA